MRIVPRTFERTRISANGTTALYVSHTSTEPYGICGHNSSLTALVGQGHTVVYTGAFVKFKSPKVHPCASAHLLVYGKDSLLSFVVNSILCIINAIVHGLIAHIYCVAAFLLEKWLPNGSCLVGLACCGDSPGGTHSEGVLSVAHYSSLPSKSPFTGCCPRLAIAMLGVERLAIRQTSVVVYDNLFRLPVALAWSEDIGTGILKHRYEEWHHYGLCEKVFGCAEEVWSLPFPEPFFLVVVSSMACP